MAKLPRELARRMRSAARLYAVQALFQMEAQGTPLDEIIGEFERFRIGMELDGEVFEDADVALFRTLVTEALNHQARIDQMTDRALVAKWPIDRIDPTIRALFRAAGAELVAEKTPPKVIITEFVDVAKAFTPDAKETGFVSAVLDHIAREVRGEF